MPTTVTKTIKASGGDYTSLAAWDAAQAGDLPTLDEIRQAECYAGATVTGSVLSGSWVTDATRYIRVYTPASERHAGVWNDAKFKITATFHTPIDFPANIKHIRYEGLQISHTNSSDATVRTIMVRCGVGAASDIRISHCILKGIFSGTAGSSGCMGMDFWDSQVNKVWNCIIYDYVNGTSANFRAIYKEYFQTAYIQNCTVFNCRNGYVRTQGTAIVKNCIAQDCNDGFNGTFDGASDYNLSDITGDAPGTNSKNNVSVSFVDEANDDFHLAAGDTQAKDAGTNLSGDAIGFTDDIDGETRSGTWDMGADEVAAAAPAAPTAPRILSKTDGVRILSAG